MNTNPTSQIQQIRVAESVAGELRNRILRGDFPTGTLPKQDELRDEYGISHPSLREALRILETEGLVAVRRGNVGGATVQPPSEGRFAYSLGLSLQGADTKVHSLADSVARLEPVCARMCAEDPDRGKRIVPKLREILADIPADIDGPGFTRMSRTFHEAIVDLCGNYPLQLIVGGLVKLWSAQEEVWAELLNAEGRYPVAEERSHAAKAHQRLVDLIEAGRVDEAERVSRKHLEETQQLVLSYIENRRVDASSPRARRALLSR